jgi:hypothetical protein
MQFRSRTIIETGEIEWLVAQITVCAGDGRRVR